MPGYFKRPCSRRARTQSLAALRRNIVFRVAAWGKGEERT